MADINLPDVVTHMRVDTSGMDKGVGRAAAMGGAIGGAVGGAVGGIVTSALAKVGDFVSGSVDQFAQLEDATAAAGVVFGDSMKIIQDQANNAASTLGLSKSQVIDAANTFGTLGKAAGLQGKPLAGFATDMTTLAGNLASFKGGTAEDAITAVGAAMRGESEPIRRYGVLLDDNTLKNRAMAMGLIKNTKEALSPQNKTLAAQAEILAQTKDASGDFARTSDSTANTQKRLAAETANAQAALGEKLAPAFTAVRSVGIKAMTGLVDGIGKVAPVLSGVKDKVAAALGDAGINIDPQAALDGLKGFGQKVLDTIGPIDFGSIFASLQGMAQQLIDAIGPIDFGPVLQSVQDIILQIVGAVAPIYAALFGLFQNGIFPVILTVVGVIRDTFVPVIMSVAGAFRDQLGPTIQTISEVMTTKVIPAIQGFMEKIKGAITDAQPFISLVAAIAGWLGRLAAAILGPVLRALFRLVGTLLGAVFGVLGTLIGWIGKVLGWIGRLPASIAAAARKFGEFVTAVKGAMSRAWEAITGAVERFKTAGGAIIQGLIDGITDKVGDAVDAVKTGLGKIRDLLPFSPAKTGPFSGRGWTLYSGQSMMTALGDGITSRTKYAVDAASRAMAGVSGALDTEQALSDLSGSTGPSRGSMARPAVMTLHPEALQALARAVSSNVKVLIDGDSVAAKVSTRVGEQATRYARTGG